MGKDYKRENILYKEKTTQRRTIQGGTTLLERKTTQKKDYIKKNYTGKNCIEEKLHYTNTRKKLHREKTIQQRDYTRKRLYKKEVQVKKEKLYKKDYNIEKEDYTGKRLHKEKLYRRGYITQRKDYTRKKLYKEGLYYITEKLYRKKTIQEGTT